MPVTLLLLTALSIALDPAIDRAFQQQAYEESIRSQQKVYEESHRAECKAMTGKGQCDDQELIERQLEEWLAHHPEFHKWLQPMPPVEHVFKPISRLST
jgi:hypothetical protein